ncbi:MAG: hypothetical protein A2Y22_08580 [Clostridiales bacterium GWD2_32_59]|nr:MAG: hypothetical protein A2Y22_08580 [Clostridiales bacterium GWD2_32_59]
MSDNKKYYYLKLKETFFDDDRVKILESSDKGVFYSNLLLKLYLKALKQNGKLMVTDAIPYDAKMISQVTNLDIDTVRVGLKVLKQMNFIEVIDNGAIYILDIQHFIGTSTTEADRVRKWRKEIDDNRHKPLLTDVTNVTTNVTEEVACYICTPEKELELEKELDLEIEKENTIVPDIQENDKLNYEEVRKIFNTICCKLNGIRVLSDQRKQLIRLRVKTLEKLNVGYNQYFATVAEIPFLNGDNDRGWKADFDWLLKETNMLKVLEGKYSSEKQKYSGINEWLNEMQEGDYNSAN